jgi:hypothetical protein
MRAVIWVTGVSFEELTGRSHKWDFVYARMIYAFFRKNHATVGEIAGEIKHSHSLVSHYLKKYPDEYRYNGGFRRMADEVSELLKMDNK